MRGHEDRHLRHYPVSEARVGSESGKRFKRIHDDPGLLDLLSTLGAFVDVRAKRGDAETGFAVDQQVDLVGE
ncbi:MAG: hypothetical protein ABJE10_01190 [bacterium]